MVSLFSLVKVCLVDGTSTILKDITVEIPDRGISVIVGPSGSGKSTMLRTLNALERPTSGSISFRGERFESLDVRQLRRRVGMVFQRPTVFDGTSGENLLVADPTLDRAGLITALERVGLPPELLDRDARQLSGGEAQRLCLARTLVTEPEVILMDEPTSALDAESMHLIEHLAQEIAESGVRILWVTHDRAQVKRLATWIGRIEGGVLVDSGPASAVGHAHGDDGMWRTVDSAEGTEG